MPSPTTDRDGGLEPGRESSGRRCSLRARGMESRAGRRGVSADLPGYDALGVKVGVIVRARGDDAGRSMPDLSSPKERSPSPDGAAGS